MSLRPGTIVGSYEIVAPIGAGGMGEVYRARDPKLERDVALKILLAQLAESSEHLRRFEQEARAASALNHPGIVTIYDVGRDSGGAAFIAMELIEGRDLRSLMADGPMPIRQVLRIAAKVADALSAAHERGIVHRDLKPENIIVSHDGFVKILDFGLAKLVRPLSQDAPTLPHTHPGAVFGTIGYMSPEQASGRPTDFRSDQFALGVIIYELLSQHRPFEEPSAPETMTAIIRSQPPPLSRAGEPIPPELERVIYRCLQKEPRDRYGSTRDLARDLREVRDWYSSGSGRRSAPPYLTRHRSFPIWSVAAITAGIVLAAAAVWTGTRMYDSGRAVHPVRSLGILPFRDATGTPEGQPFVDGVAETIGARLTQANAIRIAPLLDGSARGPLSEIARRRGADLLLRGTVQRSGDQLRVSYAIFDPASGEEIAGDSVTGPSSQIFQIEDSVAEHVLHALKVAGRPPTKQPSGLDRAEDQAAYLEAVGLLTQARNEQAVDRAIEKLQRLLIDARDSVEVNGTLSRALATKYQMARKANYLEDATLYAERAVQLDPDAAAAQVALGNVRRFSGRTADAMASYRRALEIQPNLADAVIGTAETFEAMGRAGDAKQAYQRAIELRPDNANYFNRFGAFCFARGDYRRAVELFRRMTELLPDAARGYTNLGGALLALGRYDEALAAYERSNAIAPNGLAWSNIGTARFLLQRYPEACTAFEKAAALSPDDYRIWANLGDAYRWTPSRKGEAAGAYGRAIAEARATLAHDPSNALARATIALCLAKTGDATQARSEIREALTVDPTDANVLYFAAIVSELAGDHDRAADWLQRSIAAGFSPSAALRDPELSALRSRDDVRRLLAQAS